nr:uncharacterized protein LOC103413075 [Malus domestica]
MDSKMNQVKGHGAQNIGGLEYFLCMLRVNCLPILGAAIPRLIDRVNIESVDIKRTWSLIGGDPEQQFAMCYECLQMCFNVEIEMSIFPIQSLGPFEASKKFRVCVSKMWRQKVFKSDIQCSHLHCILVDALVDLKEIKYTGDW